MYIFRLIFFQPFSIVFFPSDAILPILYTYVREEDGLFLKGYKNDCTVSSLLLYTDLMTARKYTETTYCGSLYCI
jgi:hypothetical protein